MINANPSAGCDRWPSSADRAARRRRTSRNTKSPRTPWGDPDLQGNYTNLYENGTPLERPEGIRRPRASRTSRARSSPGSSAATQERTINNFQGPIHAPDNWWQDALNLEAGAARRG